MIKKALLLTLICGLSAITLQAQQPWSLEKCIRHAQQNSLSMKQAEVGVENANLTLQSSKSERLPNLSAGVSGGYSFGRTIDPITNTFENQARGSNSFNVSANYLLYNGGRINNSVEQGQINIAAQKAETQNIANTIALNVAAAYINILFSEEQLANAQKTLELSQDQLAQTNRLIAAGSLPENENLQILAQIAQNEQLVITQENAVTIGYLNLRNLLLLDDNEDFQIVNPGNISIPVDSDPDLYKFESIYAQALQTQPIIRAGELRRKAAELDVDIAKAGILPTLSFFGNLRTDFATGVPDFMNVIGDPVEVLGDPTILNVNGADVEVRQYVTSGLEFADRQYFDQIGDNFGQSVGLSLNIPIYSQDRNKINMERARLNIISTEVTNEQNKQNLKANIQLAIADAKAAKKQMEAAQRSVDALDAAYVNTGKRFELGAANSFEFTSAKNQLDQAQVTLTIAKYDYLYKLKIVDFYKGEQISLD